MRHSVCPKCDMKNIAESVGCKFTKNCLFPCICKSNNEKLIESVASESATKKKNIRTN